MEKIVLVTWRDSSSLSNSWESEEAAMEFIDDECIITQVGFVLEENKKYILLCSRVSDFSQSKTKGYGDVFKIPKSCIIKQKVLKNNKVNT